MSIPIKLTKTADEFLVAEILASWSIEDVRQLIEEFEAELTSPPSAARRLVKLPPIAPG